MANLNLDNSQYFKNLPIMIKESILQSGVSFGNEDDLKNFVAGLTKNIVE